jgi:hypothetical protein
MTKSYAKKIDKKNVIDNNYYNTCKKCENLRSNRSHHCSVCNKCIEKMDHHCYLINNCVGKYNYKYFLSYIFLAIINSGIIAILSYMNLKKYIKKLKEYYFKNKGYYPLKFQLLIHLPKSNLVTLLLGIFSFCGLIYFFCFHIYLIYFNLTTLEMKFPQQRKKDEEDKKNKNFKEKINSIYDDNILNIFWPD